MASLGSLRTHWSLLAKTAAWLIGVVATFVVSPPMLSAGDPTNFLLRFSQFVFAILVGLYFFSPGRVAVQRWRLVSLSLLAAGVALFFVYVLLTSFWSCQYDVVGKLVIGDDNAMTPAARRFFEGGATTCERLIMAASGSTELIWPRGDLITRYVVMSVAYTAAILCLSAAAMAMLESLREQPRGRGRPGRGPTVGRQRGAAAAAHAIPPDAETTSAPAIGATRSADPQASQ